MTDGTRKSMAHAMFLQQGWHCVFPQVNAYDPDEQETFQSVLSSFFDEAMRCAERTTGVTAGRRTSPRRPVAGRQQRGDRTRELLIEETVRCIREEGYSAASARHIIERAGVSWGVIQHHFGDRDGLLTAVIDDAVDRLVASLEMLADPERPIGTEELVSATWEAFANPKAMAGLEILIATKELRSALGGEHLKRLGAALAALIARMHTGTSSEHAVALGMLLWTTPVAMMLAEMFATPPLTVDDAQQAVAKLIDEFR